MIAIMLFVWSIGRYVDMSWMIADSAAVLTAFTFSLVHANLAHLSVNTISLMAADRVMRALPKWLSWMVSYLCSAAAMLTLFAFGAGDRVAGASGLVFAMLGLFTGIYIIRKEKRVSFYSSMAFVLALPFLFPNVCAIIHVIAFIYGFIAGKMICFIDRIAHAGR